MDNKASEQKVFDLEERTACFAESIIQFAKEIPKNEITRPMISQVVRAATSVGANYCEANDAGTKKDFRYRINICRKEAKETKYWIRMIVKAVPGLRNDAKSLWQEANELNLIFSSIYRKR